MPITPGEGEFWKEYRGQLKKAMDFIADHGVSPVTRDELKRIANPIIREAKKRMLELEIAGLTDSPAYRYIKRNEINFTVAGRNTNAIKHNLKEASEFLKKQTSTVKGAQQFLDTTIDKWVGKDTTREEREKIWDLYHRLEELHPGYFARETYGSDELSTDIYDIYSFLQKDDWDVNAALLDVEKELNADLFAPEWEDTARARWSGRL